MTLDKYTFSRSRLLALAIVLFCINLGITAYVAHQVKLDIEGNAVHNFAHNSDRITQKIQERLWSYSLLLRGAAGLFVASEHVTRQEWQAYVERLEPQKNLPGVQGIGLAMVIAPNELDQHTAKIRAEGFPHYSIFPQGVRDLYTSIIYLEPFSGRNLRAFGYDMYSEPVRRTAMQQARDSGESAISGKVELLQENGEDVQAGVLIYSPIYRHNMPKKNVAQRQAALIGWTYSPYRMNDLMRDILRDWQNELGKNIEVTIYDNLVIQHEALLFSSAKHSQHSPVSLFYQLRTIDFNGHHWLLVFDRQQAYATLNYTSMWFVVISGVLISLLFLGLELSFINTSANAEYMAKRLTKDLQDNQQQLQESELRWKFALEGSGLGVWDWNISNSSVEYSSLWKTMLGYADDDISNSFNEWKSRIHPDDTQHTLATINDCLEGKTLYFANEHRLLCKDGSYLWILDRGMVIGRNADGKPLRMIGTHADISQSKQAHLRIEQLGKLYAALSACNAAIVHCHTQEKLFAEICRVVVDFGGMKMAWIGLVDEATGNILPVHAYGNGTDYLDGITISIHGNVPEGRGATGTATRENQPFWIDDFSSNPITLPWRERAARYGWVASAALPICRKGKAIGALTFYSSETHWFTDEIRALLKEMTANISFALDKFASEAEADTRQISLLEAEQRFRCVVEQSITGAYIYNISEKKFIYANPRLAEILGYESGDELIGKSITDIIPAQELKPLTNNLKRLLAGKLIHTESAFSARRKDGSLVNVSTNSSLGVYQQQQVLIGVLQDTTSSKVAEQHIRRYAQQLENIFMQTVGLATTLSEMRDPYTAGHEQRVAEIAVAIGKEMALDHNTLEGLRVGGYLHDVGKMRVPIDILSKPGKLTPSEYALIKEHAQSGYDVLKDVEFPWPIAEIARQHHERVDGSGYPRGLQGNNILLEARIIAVADVIESMAAHRPYRPGLGIEAALAEIERGTGTAYDTAVAEACLRLFREKGYVLQQAE